MKHEAKYLAEQRRKRSKSIAGRQRKRRQEKRNRKGSAKISL
jgi:hypothetical protein